MCCKVHPHDSMPVRGVTPGAHAFSSPPPSPCLNLQWGVSTDEELVALNPGINQWNIAEGTIMK